MDADEPGWQLIDDFFAREARGRAEPTVRRYVRVRHRLVQFLDTADMSDHLGAHPATLLAAERQFHDHGAFWHLFGPAELVCALPGFLHSPWLPDLVGEARTQVSLVSRLLSHVSHEGLIDLAVAGCAYWDAEDAVKRARAELDQRAAVAEPDPWSQQMPPRFRQEPGPQW